MNNMDNMPFEKFDYNADVAVEAEFTPMSIGTHKLTIDSIDEEKAVLVNEQGEMVYQKLWDNTIEDLKYTFEVATEAELIGASKELEVTHTEHEGNTYARVKLKQRLPEPGNYRVRIKKAEAAYTATGIPKIALQLELPNSPITIYYDIMVQSGMKVSKAGKEYDAGAMTSRNIKKLYNSFAQITANGKINQAELDKWVGKTGAAKLNIELYKNKNGESAKKMAVKYFLDLEEQQDLPAWGKEAPKVNPMQDPDPTGDGDEITY